MATYLYSTQATSSIAFTAADYLSFDDERISAASLTIDSTTVPASPVITVPVLSNPAAGSKGYTLTNFGIQKFSTTNFVFADGSKLQIGDGTTGITNDDAANIITGTDYDDYLDGQGNTDTISYATATSAVAVNLTTTAAQNTGGAGTDKILNFEKIIGSAFNDTLTGTTSGDTLDGGLGIDSLNGGAGNDTYIVTAGDVITDSAGTDDVQSSADYTLGSGLENLTLLTGAANGIGNSAANTLTGNSLNNVLDGAATTDTDTDGAGADTDTDGADTLVGGAGNDTYIVRDGDETITELATTGSGTDSVLSTATYTLPTNVENLRLLGSAAINGTGNASDNIIYANSGANVLGGDDGTDTVSYQYGATRGVTVSLASTSAQTTVGSGSDTLTGFEKLIGSRYADTLTAATAVNTVDGGAGSDTLTGAGANDMLIGGTGNDTYVVGAGAIAATADTTHYGISDSAGSDTISASVSTSIAAFTSIENVTLTGSTAAIIATGNSLGNTLTSNGAANTLIGLAGDDTYVVSAGTETITEASSAGTDTVMSSATSFTLPTNVEKLTLTGSGAINGIGNSGANTLTGNSGANSINGGSGNDILTDTLGGADTLNGGAGNDSMSGGTGNDTYMVDSTLDTIIEPTSGGGTDTVEASISYTLSSSLLENLTLSSGAGDINATGNTGSNILTGNAGANILNGGTGADNMIGNDGNDTFIVDNASDTVTGGADTDTVQSSITYTIGSTIEKLTLTGASAINGTGNGSANTLTGNSANNTLSGLAGADIIIGGAGKDSLTGGNDADTFVYNAASESTVLNSDVITDFTTTSDEIDVSAIFGGATGITLSTSAFTSTGSPQVNYISGKVGFDVDGNGTADFAITLTGAPALVIGDFTF